MALGCGFVTTPLCAPLPPPAAHPPGAASLPPAPVGRSSKAKQTIKQTVRVSVHVPPRPAVLCLCPGVSTDKPPAPLWDHRAVYKARDVVCPELWVPVPVPAAAATRSSGQRSRRVRGWERSSTKARGAEKHRLAPGPANSRDSPIVSATKIWVETRLGALLGWGQHPGNTQGGLVLAKGNRWIVLFRDTGMLGAGLSDCGWDKAAEQHLGCSCVRDSTVVCDAGSATCHPQHPTPNAPLSITQQADVGLHLGRTPQAGQHRGESVPSELRSGRRVRDAVPSRAVPGGRVFPCGRSQGRQEAPGRSSPGCSDTSVTSLLRGGSGDGKRSRWHQGGNRPSAPIPRCGSLRKKQGWGPWPLRAGGAGSWGDGAASFRLPAPRSLPAAASSGPQRLPALSPGYSTPAPLHGPPGHAGTAGSLSTAVPAARLWSRRRIPRARSVEEMGRAPQARVT